MLISTWAIPGSLRQKILYLAHDIPASAHLAMAETKARLWPHFYWPRMSKHVYDYCKSCDQCQRVGKGRKPSVPVSYTHLTLPTIYSV